MNTANVIAWLDTVRDELGTALGAPEKYAEQVERVKRHVCQLDSRPLQFSTTQELFDELRQRFDSALFVAAYRPRPGALQQFYRFGSGGDMACIGLAVAAKQSYLGGWTFKEDDDRERQTS